jgi:hypothetical protein
MSLPGETPQRKTSAWAKTSLVFGWLAVANAAVNWLLILAGDSLDIAVEIGGVSLFAFAAVAVGCAIVALIVVRCRRSTHRGAGLAVLAMLLAVLAVGGFFVPLILLLSQMRMF